MASPMDYVSVIDPRIDFKDVDTMAIMRPPSVINSQTFSVSSPSSNITVSANPPSRLTAVSRVAFKRVNMTFTVTGTNTGAAPLLQAGYHAPRQNCLAAVLSSETVSLNTDTVTMPSINQYWNALGAYVDPKERQTYNSLSPSMPDQAQDYSQLTGTVRNPLNDYANSSLECDSRGGFAGYVVLTNTPTQATISLTVSEPILCSPFVLNEHSTSAQSFIGLDSITYNCTFIQDLSRALSIVQNQGSPGVVNITNITGVVNTFDVIFSYYSIPESLPVPLFQRLPYYNTNLYTQSNNVAVNPGQLVTMNSQNIQLNSIPSRIIFYIAEAQANLTAFTSDSYFCLPQLSNPLSLTFNNNSYFNSFTTEDLYNVTNANGINLSYSQFINNIGSIIALDTSRDIGLSSSEAPGVSGQYQFNFSVTMKNNNIRPIIPVLYTIVIYEGVFTIANSFASHQIGIVDSLQVLSATKTEAVSYGEMVDRDNVGSGIVKGRHMKRSVYGGSLLSRALGYVKKNRLLSRGLSLLPNPFAQGASVIAKHYGYGESGGMKKSHKKSHKKSKKKSHKKGGRKLTQAHKLAMLRGRGLV